MTKLPVKIFTNEYTVSLMQSVRNNTSLNKYQLDEFPFENRFPKGSSGVELPEDFELKIPPVAGSTKYDMENSIALFTALKNLNETQATDPRLWTFLTHVNFWKYMRVRWPVESKSKKANYIISRYFISTVNTRSFLRNGISSLWWYSKLTFDEKRGDQFELTKILLRDTDLVQGILERNLGLNKNILAGYLEYVHENDLFGSNEKRLKRRKAAEFLNLTGGLKILPSFSREEIKSMLNKYQS